MKKTTYDGVEYDAWVKELEKDNHWNKRHFWAMLGVLGAPGGILDVGCGLGEIVNLANHMQIPAYGIDQLVTEDYEEQWFFHADLRSPFSLAEHVENLSMVDMVLCWEVAEHIPDESLTIFCDTLCNHLKRTDGSYLVFTAAHPGQTGTQHINARPATFWREQFFIRGLNYSPEKTLQVTLAWLNISSPKYWLPANLQIFTK